MNGKPNSHKVSLHLGSCGFKKHLSCPFYLYFVERDSEYKSHRPINKLNETILDDEIKTVG